jgi:hypothetical protein
MFSLPITEFSPYNLGPGMPYFLTKYSTYGKDAVNVPIHDQMRPRSSKIETWTCLPKAKTLCTTTRVAR